MLKMGEGYGGVGHLRVSSYPSPRRRPARLLQGDTADFMFASPRIWDRWHCDRLIACALLYLCGAVWRTLPLPILLSTPLLCVQTLSPGLIVSIFTT